MIPEHTFTAPDIGWLSWEGAESSQEPATKSVGMSNSEGNCGSCSDVKTANAQCRTAFQMDNKYRKYFIT